MAPACCPTDCWLSCEQPQATGSVKHRRWRTRLPREPSTDAGRDSADARMPGRSRLLSSRARREFDLRFTARLGEVLSGRSCVGWVVAGVRQTLRAAWSVGTRVRKRQGPQTPDDDAGWMRRGVLTRDSQFLQPRFSAVCSSASNFTYATGTSSSVRNRQSD